MDDLPVNIFLSKSIKFGFGFFITAFITTEVLLIGEPIVFMAKHAIPHYTLLLLLFSLLLPAGIVLLMCACYATDAKKISRTIFINQFSAS